MNIYPINVTVLFRLLKVWIFRFQRVNNIWILSWFSPFASECLVLGKPACGNRNGYLFQLWKQSLLIGYLTCNWCSWLWYICPLLWDSGREWRCDPQTFHPSHPDLKTWTPVWVFLASTTAQGFCWELLGDWCPRPEPCSRDRWSLASTGPLCLFQSFQDKLTELRRTELLIVEGSMFNLRKMWLANQADQYKYVLPSDRELIWKNRL